MAFPDADRDLYFVWDILGITCNAGIGAWIHYHVADEGWINDAARAFEAIGHRSVGENLKVYRERYLTAKWDKDDLMDEDLSEIVWDSEVQIERDLYRHLVSMELSFRRPKGVKHYH